MGKRKKFDEDDELERLRQENRELKSLNRSLLKRLKKLDRHYEEVIEEAEKEESKEKETAKKENVCPKCHEGQLIISTSIPGRELIR